MIKIGEIRKAITLFYDLKKSKMGTKSRPALIIAQADADDYIVLPISRITRRINMDHIFDIEVDPTTYPMLNLTSLSYIRSHKQTVIHRGEIGDLIGDLKTHYSDLYHRVLEARELFSKEITDQALA